jgi:RNA 2',3'-cyclic 3'-phosphodiesterase
MRCFIAIDVEDDVRYDITKLQEEIKDYDVKLVEGKNLHFTLKFLGDIDKNHIGAIKERIGYIVKNTKSFEISLHGLGVFPSMDFIKVVWIGDENKDLFNLQKNIEEGFADMFRKEEPSPHLTIARLRGPGHKKEIREFVERNKHIWIGKLKVKEISLKRSYLGNRGPKYEDLAIFELTGNG